MLKDYLAKLQDLRRSHPISQADFEAWRHNIITKQLFEDLEMHILDAAGISEPAYFKMLDYLLLTLVDWKPECLEGNDA